MGNDFCAEHCSTLFHGLLINVDIDMSLLADFHNGFGNECLQHGLYAARHARLRITPGRSFHMTSDISVQTFCRKLCWTGEMKVQRGID